MEGGLRAGASRRLGAIPNREPGRLDEEKNEAGRLMS
jgi:hypothetical protein